MTNRIKKTGFSMALLLAMASSATARTFDFKALGTKGSSTGGAYWYSDVIDADKCIFPGQGWFGGET